MTGLDAARKNLPNLNGLDDAQFVDALHTLYYPDMDKASLSAQLGYAPPAPPAQQAGLARSIGDAGIKLAQGAVDLGSSVVGLGSLATGGMVGKGARALGYDPKRTNEALGDYLSDSQKAADAKVGAADGFMDTVAASMQNPRSIVGGIAESAPGMLAGMGVTGAVARGIAVKAALATAEGAAASAAELAAGKSAAAATKAALATRAGGTAAQGAIEAAGTKLMGIGSATEGAQSAGQIADDAQAAGRSYGDYALPALAAGTGTAAIGFGAGKLMGDAATELATGARSAGVHGSMAARVGKEFLSEGVLEEMPQSAQEQYFTNVAQGEQDRMKGVGNAAGAGLITGGVMGAGMGALQGNHGTPAVAPAPPPQLPPAPLPPTPLPNTGPLSQAANAGQAAAAAKATAAADAAAQSLPPLALEQINARMEELYAIGRGTPARRAQDRNGIMVTFPSIPARKYTAAEAAQFKSLSKAQAERTGIPPEQMDQFRRLQAEESTERTQRLQAAQQEAVQQQKAAQEIAQEQEYQQLLADEQAQQHQHEQARARAEAERQQQESAVTNTIVEQGRARRAAENRAALRATVLANDNIPAGHKKAAYAAALKRDGYINPTLTQEDHAEIDETIAPLPSAPNELVDAVPERKDAPATPAAPNTAAVDAAIAAGMRLKTPGGSVLHKPGSSKIFRLNSAQKTRYLGAMKRMAAPAMEAVEAVAAQHEPEETNAEVASPTNGPDMEDPAGAAPAAPDALYDQAAAFVLKNRDASIPLVQAHLKVGYNRAARLMEQMEAGGLVSTMQSDGSRAVLAADTATHDATTSPSNDLAAPADAPKEAGIDHAPAQRDAIAARYAALLAEGRDGVSADPKDFHRKFADDVLAKDAYALKWITNGMNEKSKKVFAEFTGTKLPKAQGASWTALKTWAGVTPEQDAAVTARADAARRAKQERDDDEVAEQGASGQKFKSSANDGTIISGKEAVDRQIEAGYTSIENLSKTPIPKYALVNPALGRFYPLDKVAKRYAEVALKRRGQSAIARDTDGESLAGADQARELSDAKAKGQTVVDDNDVSHLFGKKPSPPASAAPVPAPANPTLSKQELNAIYVTDMTPEQLLQAREVFAGLPRARKIDKEIQKRGLDATPAPVAPEAAPEATPAVAAPTVSTPPKGVQKLHLQAAWPSVVPKAASPATPAAPTEVASTVAENPSSIVAEPDTAKLKEVIAEAAARLAGLQKLQSEAGSNAWTYDKKIADAQRTVEAYREALARLEPAPTSTQAPAVADATSDIDTEMQDALSHLADVLADVFGAKLNITGQQHTAGALLPALSKVIELLVRRGARSLKDALAQSAKVMRANAAIAPHMDQISARQWKAAYNAIAEYHEGTDSEAAVAGIDADTVLGLVRADVATQDTTNKPEQKEQENHDSTITRRAPALDHPLDEGQRPGSLDAHLRGARPARTRAGRVDDGRVRGPGLRLDGANDEDKHLGDGRRTGPVFDRQTDVVAGSGERVPAHDFHPGIGGLTREGSWFEAARRNIDLIDLAIAIDKEGRPATPDEQARLSKYVGFGAGEIRNKIFPIPPAYAKHADPSRLIWSSHIPDARWKALAERLEALPRDWQKSVLQSSQYAHYTSEGIIRSVWSAMQRLGFTGGKVFEPGMGIGSFAMLMPDTVRQTSHYTGVEFDGPTALIAKLLSPEQNVLHDDFIKRKFPKNFFDVAIGNPPFSQTKIFGDADYEKNGFMLHDFFFAKSIDRVRPGGLLAFVTSKGTMDKQTDKARKYLAEWADLVGAIRLPSTAFEDNAGTSVVTDVIFLRKRIAGEAPGGAAWAGVQTVDTKDGPVVVNEYFATHPEMVLGQQRISGNIDDAGRRINSNGRGAEKYTVVSYDKTPAELDDKFAHAVERLPENVYSVLSQSSENVRRETAKIDFDPSVKREGVVYLAKDGTLMRVHDGVGKALDSMVKLSANDKAWFASYVGLRDLVQASRLAQATDGDWPAAIKKLNKGYDAFRKEHGPINDFRIQVRKSTDEEGNPVETESRVYKNYRRYREDYDSAIVTLLEAVNEAGEIVKGPFLLGRTIGKPVTRDVRSIGDALAVSLDAVGSLDLRDVAGRIGLSQAETIEALDRQIYKTPEGQWQLADEYLSGDVVAKLDEAEHAVRVDPALRRNVEALKEVQPEKLGPSQISAKLGASWIPASHVNAYAQEIEAGAVTFDPTTETWQVDGGNLRSQRRAGAEYGTAMRSPSELLEAALNSRPVKIVGKDANQKSVTDVAATTAANEALKKIKDKFKGWIWTDTERASELVESYNKRFNNIAPRRFDGSHLTLPGVSLRYTLHPHQLRAIWRMIQTGNTYLAHAVGAGKTIEMIAAGMEQKRLGLIKKPIYVVPNHMLEQFSNEFMELYPLANIMVADDENFSAERRKAFIASATMNAPDAIIITHDAFQRVGVKEETVAPIRDALLADLEIELSETASGNDTRVRRSQLEQQIEAVTQRFDRIIGAGGKDSTIKFEDMGVDFVFADEAHVFRKLDFHTAQQIKGIDPNGSKRALDMYVKTRWLDQQRPGRSMAFASGTPVTNTMGELYTIMRFFAADELDRAGIATFDAWARQFGEVTPALEPNAAGKYELIERFAKFDNVPELMSRVRQFMDVLTSESLGALVKRPDLAGGKPRLNIVAPSAALDAYMKTQLAPRIQKSKDWKPTKEEPNNPDPIVAIITDGRFAAIDPRFFGGNLDPDGESIITTMGDKVVAGYHAGSGNVYFDKEGKPEPLKGSTQIVFYNLGFGEQSQKNRGFNSRAAFTKRLTDGGIPRAHIAWFDDANSDAKKEAIFKAMRSGKIRVLIGSAKKMGTGVNVQKRLALLHYQDPPWFPADVEQPHGRIIRQGNQNNEVGIEWYTTKGTYQSTMWQMVARKQRFIDQAFTGDKSMRSMDDMGEASLFEQAAAVASGDPRAIQLAGLKQDVERYERLQAAHASEQIAVRSALRGAEWEAESAARAVVTYGNAFKAIGERFFTFTTAKVGAAEFHKMGEFGQALKVVFNQTVADAVTHPAAGNAREVASLGDQLGITMEGTREPQHQELTGNFELLMNVGGLRMQIALAPGMGADIDATGLARRVVNKINGIEPELQAARRRKNGSETDVVRLRKKLGAPFEYQQEMAEKYGDLKRLEEELRQEGLKKDDPAPATGRINADGSTGQQAAKAPAMPLQRADGSFARQAPLDGLLFSRAGESGDVLQQISQIGDAFRYRTSDKDTVEGITHDVDADVKVKKITSIPGETRYEFAFPDQTTARLMVRPFNQYGKSVYGFELDIDGEMDNVVDERPGQFSDEAYGKGDVWIDVSLLNEGGGYGAKMYHIAANYAHNTNNVFIGDPAGMSHAALLRRPEQMLSSALKFGTTEHLAPHPKQIKGNAANGIAPLDWIYGDHLGNIHKLIDVNLKHIDNAGGNGGIGYDKHAGRFTAEDGSGLTRKDLLGLAKAGLARTAAAGGGTLARYALLSAGLRELRAGPGERRPGGILVFLRDQLRDHVSAVDQGSGKLKEIFYSRRVDGTPDPGIDSNDFHADLPAAPTLEAGDAGAVPAPATLSGRDLLQARKDGQVLNRALAGAGMDPVRILRTAPNQQFAIARKIGEALGIKVNFIGGADGFDGVAYKGVAYLADGMTHPALAIAGHETLHALEQSNPALGERLRAQIRDYLKDGVVLDRQAREEVLSGFMDIPYAKAEGEVLADINGAMWMDPVFWRDLAKADHNLFRQVAYKFMQIATKAIDSLRGSRFDVSTLVRDVAAVRAIMVATWAGHARGLTGGDARAALDRQRGAGRQFAVAALQYGGRAAYASLRAVGATMLSYPQWVVTKTPNFQQFYGDWENSNAADRDTSGFYPGAQGGDDNRRDHRGADVAAPGRPTFPGQCGPIRAFGSPESATGGRTGAGAAREPALYYHGSRADVDSFDLNHGDRKDNGWLGTGVYVTTDEDLAHSYASLKRGAAGPNIAPLFVAVRNPYVATPALKAQLRTASRAGIDLFTSKLVAAGHDGVVLNFPDGSQELVAFNPAAVKSAIGNNGGFDAGSADIRFSRFGLGDALASAANSINAVRLPANYLVGDLFNDAGKLNWWHKTVGTMDNLAKRAPAFAKVYEAVQSFIGDVSRYAVVAADLAPTLLPKLENVRDIVGAARKKPLTAADTKAIGAPIFEGTLVWARDEHGDPIKVKELEERAEKLTTDQKAQILLEKRVIDDGQNKAWRNNPLDFYEATIKRRFNESQLKAGVVWSGAELRAMFGLTDTQIGQYREFRAATDKSLTNLSISEMVKLGGKDAKGMMERAVAAGNIHQAAELLRDHFIALAKAEPEKLTMHLDTAKQIMDLADKGADLMARGYAPLSRFGKYTVYVQEDEEQAYFGMFESQFEASKMARRMRTEYPGAAVTHGTVSQEAYKLFAGVSPETIELFGSMVGLDSQADAKSTEVYQTYLKLAKNNRSSMKRLIQRKGIAGFSEDAGRVLAGFIYSNARLTAGNAHLGDIDAAITKIPKQEGELADAAVQLRDHIKNPESGGVKLGGLMFAQFLGGSVASAMVNLTQPLTMTLPYLSQFGGIGKAGKRLVAAVRDAGKATTGEAGLDAAMKWATEEGIVAPQEVHYLQAQAAGTGALQSGDGTTVGDTRAALNNTLSKVMVGWGKLFAMAELTNRRVTFIAAYRTAVEEGMGDPARFAQESVSQTQGVYNPGNKPKWARGALGGLAMTFKQYSIAYVELLSRMAFAGEPGSPERAAGRRGALYMLAVLFLMSGADGLPFEQDLEDVIDGAMQRMGYNFSTKREKQAFLTEALGAGAADFALKGISSMPGMPIDVAGRFGMGNLIPATGVLTKKDSYASDIAELAGPAGDFVKRTFSATGKALGGDLGAAALDISPMSARNLAKGVDMLSSGAYKDARGYKVNDVTPLEGAMKIVGFQPNSTANIQDAKGQALSMIAQNRMRSAEIQEHWAQGIVGGDEDMIREARAWRDDWNRKNADTPVNVNMPALMKRVRAMRQDVAMRTQATAPKALKQAVRNELMETRG